MCTGQATERLELLNLSMHIMQVCVVHVPYYRHCRFFTFSACKPVGTNMLPTTELRMHNCLSKVHNAFSQQHNLAFVVHNAFFMLGIGPTFLPFAGALA